MLIGCDLPRALAVENRVRLAQCIREQSGIGDARRVEALRRDQGRNEARIGGLARDRCVGGTLALGVVIPRVPVSFSFLVLFLVTSVLTLIILFAFAFAQLLFSSLLSLFAL